MLYGRFWMMSIGMLSWLMAVSVAFAQAPEKEKPAPKRYMPVRHTAVTVVKVDTAKSTISLKGVIRGTEQEFTLPVPLDSKLMKEGKDVKLADFKEGEQLLVHWRTVKKERVVRFLADPPTFFAFLRYPTIKAKVKSFDVSTLTLTVEAEGKEHNLQMPGRGHCCFVGGKAHKSKEALLKGGEEVIVVLGAPDRARAVFDAASWKVYGELEWKEYQKRAKAKKKGEG